MEERTKYRQLQPERCVAHEPIDTALCAQPCGELRGQIPEMVSIPVRPPQVDERIMPGH